MAAEWICDGCGKRVPAVRVGNGWGKPTSWYQRADDEDGIQDACSRECIDVIAKATAKTRVILPF